MRQKKTQNRPKPKATKASTKPNVADVMNSIPRSDIGACGGFPAPRAEKTCRIASGILLWRRFNDQASVGKHNVYNIRILDQKNVFDLGPSD